VTKEQNKLTKAEDRAQVDLSNAPKWRPSGKSQWMLEVMLEALRDGVGDPRQGAVSHLLAMYVNVLATTGYYLSFIEEEHPWDNRLSETFIHLAQTLVDLRIGVIDPLLKPKRASKRDSTYYWLARMHVVLALEYFHRSERPYAQTAKMVAAKFPELEHLKRGERRGLPSSMLSWRIQFLDDKVPIPDLRRMFKEQYKFVHWVHIENCRDFGEDELESAVQMARRLIQPNK
jgi:hypothetical protein